MSYERITSKLDLEELEKEATVKQGYKTGG